MLRLNIEAKGGLSKGLPGFKARGPPCSEAGEGHSTGQRQPSTASDRPLTVHRQKSGQGFYFACLCCFFQFHDLCVLFQCLFSFVCVCVVLCFLFFVRLSAAKWWLFVCLFVCDDSYSRRPRSPHQPDCSAAKLVLLPKLRNKTTHSKSCST